MPNRFQNVIALEADLDLHSGDLVGPKVVVAVQDDVGLRAGLDEARDAQVVDLDAADRAEQAWKKTPVDVRKLGGICGSFHLDEF